MHPDNSLATANIFFSYNAYNSWNPGFRIGLAGDGSIELYHNGALFASLAGAVSQDAWSYITITVTNGLGGKTNARLKMKKKRNGNIESSHNNGKFQTA